MERYSTIRRGVTALILLVAGLTVTTLSFNLAADPTKHKIPVTGDTLALAPMTLGNPMMAASLSLRLPEIPGRMNIGPPDVRYEHTVRVGRGDTLTGVLIDAGIPEVEARYAITAVRPYFNARRIKPGHEITLTFQPSKDELAPDRFLGLAFDADIRRQVRVSRRDDGKFSASEEQRDLTHRLMRASGTIRNSLFVDASRAGVPASVLVAMIRAYSWDVDFQRDIRRGDGFEILYEALFDEEGQFTRAGGISYGNLVLRGKDNPIYRYTTADGEISFFDDRGRSAKKALMRTPINGARLSSGFGTRRHPILGYKKRHRGIDFAAPRGTPIYAAGSGSVVQAGRNGAYGKYVKIRHNGQFSTAYAHMSRIARGMRRGKRLRQGQIIGYVGTTGRSTGPHLHYEILRGGRRVNPMRVKMPSGRKLRGKELAQFLEVKQKTDVQYAGADRAVKVARRGK